jgi:stage V sporulation protein D (sporulation-specific penicillin-binding protein)
LDIITSSFGQSISATPLQVLSAISTIANGGKRMQPYIVDAIMDDNGTNVTVPQVISQPISEDTADSVAEMMKAVVEEGGISEAESERVKDYEISAKTGTAQVVEVGEHGYQEGKTIASYIGFTPTSDPQMIMIVRIAEPQVAEFSTFTAVPVWNDIFLEIVNDLEIPKRN